MTPTEIDDFIRLVKELERQMKSVHMYFLDRGAEYFDNSHIFLPSMTKEELEQLAQEIGE